MNYKLQLGSWYIDKLDPDGTLFFIKEIIHKDIDNKYVIKFYGFWSGEWIKSEFIVSDTDRSFMIKTDKEALYLISEILNKKNNERVSKSITRLS